jgi:glycerophosphoryl diester phosphodiesterase
MLLLSVLAFDLQGHRGARGLRPENTLAAFEHALELGVDTLELDLGLTSDGVLVVHHDPHLSGASARLDGVWLEQPIALHTLTLDQVQRYDVGRLNPDHDYAERWPEQVPVDGQSPPTLQAVLALSDTVRFNIETKLDPKEPGHTATPEAFAVALREAIPAELRPRVTIQSFDWRTLELLDDEFETACLTSPKTVGRNSPWTGSLRPQDYSSIPELVHAAGCDVWSPFHLQVRPRRVEQAHALGLRVIPWTVNTPDRAEELVAMGVDGLITDYPDRIVRP